MEQYLKFNSMKAFYILILILQSLQGKFDGLVLSPPMFIKLTHSRMSVGYHEWPGVLFISVWRA